MKFGDIGAPLINQNLLGLSSRLNSPRLDLSLIGKTIFSAVPSILRTRITFNFDSRWSELTRKIELWTEIQELNDQGEYAPVEVNVTNNNILTGGVYQLRQGQQRRIKISVKPVQNSGTLPIICDSITNIAIGSIINR